MNEIEQHSETTKDYILKNIRWQKPYPVKIVDARKTAH